MEDEDFSENEYEGDSDASPNDPVFVPHAQAQTVDSIPDENLEELTEERFNLQYPPQQINDMFFACCDWEDAREADSCPVSIDDSIGDDFSDLGEDRPSEQEDCINIIDIDNIIITQEADDAHPKPITLGKRRPSTIMSLKSAPSPKVEGNLSPMGHKKMFA